MLYAVVGGRAECRLDEKYIYSFDRYFVCPTQTLRHLLRLLNQIVHSEEGAYYLAQGNFWHMIMIKSSYFVHSRGKTLSLYSSTPLDRGQLPLVFLD